jgi:hypothetical protein
MLQFTYIGAPQTIIQQLTLGVGKDVGLDVVGNGVGLDVGGDVGGAPHPLPPFH